jgi:hypothetical protein
LKGVWKSISLPSRKRSFPKSPTMPVRDAERLVKEPCAFLSRMPVSAAVQKGIAQADRGEFIGEQEMDARIEQMLNS